MKFQIFDKNGNKSTSLHGVTCVKTMFIPKELLEVTLTLQGGDEVTIMLSEYDRFSLMQEEETC